MKTSSVSTVIIARNAEDKIGDCLKSVQWADEILVVDNASIDKTADISKKFGAKVIAASEKLALNYSALRTLGLKEAKQDWILYVDADERVTKSLKNEIIHLVKDPSDKFIAYVIPRKNFIFGREFKHCGQSPDYQKRLFRKEYLKEWKGELHEEPVFEGELGYLKNPLIHLKEDNLSDMVKKTNLWSDIEAMKMYQSGHPPMNIIRFGSAMFREFWLRMVVQMAFLDGGEGIIYGLYQVYSRFISYAKLWELQLEK